MMSHAKPLIALAVVCLCALTPGPSAALPAAAQPQSASLDVSSPPASDTWVGALAAIGCGLSIKVTILTGGTVVATIAAAVSTCALMILDGLLDPR